MCVCVCTHAHIQVCQSSVRESASPREWHTTNHTQWPERHGQPDPESPPEQTWGCAMGEWGDLSRRGTGDRFGKWRQRQDASATPRPWHWRRWSGMGQGWGTASGRTWMGSPGLQLRVPGASPKGICSGVLMRTPQGVPESAPRSPVLRVWMALGTDAIASRGLAETHDYLPVPTQSEKGALLPPLWGPWVGGDASVLVAAWQEQSQEVRKTPRSQLQMSRVALSVPLSSELLHTAATVWGQGKKYCWNMRERFLKVQPWSAFWRKERKTAVYFPVLGFEVKEHQGSGKAAWRFSRPLPPAILGRSGPVHFPNLQPYLWACLYSSLIHFQKPQQFLNQMTWLHSLNANHEIIALKKKERN